jgi:hypothetical protein
MFYDLISEHLAGQVAHELMHADHDAALSVPSEGARLDARINGRPLGALKEIRHMIPVEAHLVLNHVPLIGLLFGLVFFVAGLMRSSEQALRAGLRIFLAMGIAVLPVVGSGLVSGTILADAAWLDAHTLSNHRLAGILTLVVLVGLGTLCGAALFISTRNGRAISVRVRNAVLFLALVGLGANVWTAYLGGTLRHTELASDQPRSMESLGTR